MKRSIYAGRVRSEHIGNQLTLKGWVGRRRDLGGLIFIDLRDREGVMQLVINPEEAKIVQKIFDMYLQGIGSFKIAAKLNEEGVQTITGKKWQDTTIRGMLKNEK